MTTSSPKEITQLLLDWNSGDRAALDKLIPVVYQELRQAAKRYLKRERADHTLQTTALVNEVYLRLIDVRQMQLQNRAHFFAISAQLMRQILVDFARRRGQLKRGGDFTPFAKRRTQTRGTRSTRTGVFAVTSGARLDPAGRVRASNTTHRRGNYPDGSGGRQTGHRLWTGG